MSFFREYIPFYKRNLKVAGPVMLTQLGAGIAGIVDSIMVGHYGTTELAAVSFANSIFFTWMVFAMGALMGITPLTGYAFVQHDEYRLKKLWHGGMVFSVLLSLAMILMLVAVGFVMPYMGQDPEVIDVAMKYYALATVSTIPFLFYHAEKQYLEGLGNTTIAMVVMILINLLNIPLNWVLIYGHCGLPALGATGAGLATLFVRTLQPLIIYWIIRRKAEWGRYTMPQGRPDSHTLLESLRSILKLGLPIGLQQTMEILAFTLAVTLMGWISKEAVAAHTIVNNISDLTFLVSTGIGAATTIRVSHQFGAGRIYDMHMAAKAAIHMALVWSFLAAALCIGGSALIPHVFTNDPAVIAIATPLMVLCGLFQISDALQCVGGAMLRGISDVRVPMIIAFVVYIVIALPLGYILMFPCGLGANGMWIAFIVGLTLAAIFLLARFVRIAPKP